MHAKLASYSEELQRLSESYAVARRADVGDFVELQTSLADRPAIFVASGGGLAVAQIAAEAQARAYGALAVATTPLAMVGEATVRDASVVVISSRAAHADIAFCLSQARERHNYPIALVTHRHPSDLNRSVTRHVSQTIYVPPLVRDGFLATNSTLALATMFLRAADPEVALPELPWLDNSVAPLSADRLIVLFGPGQRAAAMDLEIRLSEIGLASVQLADYRNFAHGRHTGFARNQPHTQIIALADSATRGLAEAVLNLLPAEANIYRISSDARSPASGLDLLCASMRVVGATAEVARINPARPKVPPFGRKLYHQSARRHMALKKPTFVDRKIAAGKLTTSEMTIKSYTEAYRHWCEDISSTTFGGIVLDYDGTLCDTSERYSLPRVAIQDTVRDLLSQDCRIGIATGRGVSLQTELRTWIPRDDWGLVTLGLYNGGLVMRLDQSPWRRDVNESFELPALAQVLVEEPLGSSVKIEERDWQLSIRPIAGSRIGVEAVASWVGDCLARQSSTSFKILKSGHSVDVVPSTLSKASVVEQLEGLTGKPAMAIGDRGEIGGNDFELLASRPWTLSVDRCSGDPTRCWNVAPNDMRGPDAVIRYLRRFKRNGSGWNFTPPSL